MTDKAKIRRYLWDSLEMGCLRRDFLLTGLLVGITVCLQACTSFSSGDWAWTAAVIVSAIVLLPFWSFYLWRTIMIFRKPEEYFFCRCKLSSVHHKPFLKGAMYFTVVIEDPEGKRFAADTHAIFAAYGLMEPLLENYINRTVTIAYNRETGMVVVIG